MCTLTEGNTLGYILLISLVAWSVGLDQSHIFQMLFFTSRSVNTTLISTLLLYHILNTK